MSSLCITRHTPTYECHDQMRSNTKQKPPTYDPELTSNPAPHMRLASAGTIYTYVTLNGGKEYAQCWGGVGWGEPSYNGTELPWEQYKKHAQENTYPARPAGRQETLRGRGQFRSPSELANRLVRGAWAVVKRSASQPKAPGARSWPVSQDEEENLPFICPDLEQKRYTVSGTADLATCQPIGLRGKGTRIEQPTYLPVQPAGRLEAGWLTVNRNMQISYPA